MPPADDTARLFDPGLQPERTELAWRRTALAIGVGSIVALRALPDVLGGIGWIAPGLVGVAFAAVLWVAAGRRLRRANDVLLARAPGAVLPSGRLLLILAIFVTAVGAFGATLVIALAR